VWLPYTAEGGVYYAFQGDEDQQDLRPRAQTIADFKDFITKFYPANQQQTFIYRQAAAPTETSLHVCHQQPSCSMLIGVLRQYWQTHSHA
jgi:hypothetical protein